MDDEQALAARLAHAHVAPGVGPGIEEVASPSASISTSRSHSQHTASSTDVFAPDVFARRRARPQPAVVADAAALPLPFDPAHAAPAAAAATAAAAHAHANALRSRPSAPLLAPRLSRGLSQDDEKDSLAPASSTTLSGSAPPRRGASPLKQPVRISSDGGSGIESSRSASLVHAPVVDFSHISIDAPAAVSVEDESKSKDAVRSLPSTAALNEAGRAVVYKENGAGIKFGELFASRKTLVIFTSDWHDMTLEPYLKTLCNVNMASLGKAGVSLIILGQGSVAEMTALQEVVPVPFSLYTDVDRSVYRALGMDHPIDGCGSTGTGGGAGGRKRSKASLRKNLLHIAPHRHVLGGEFLLGPGLRCGFAHRLTSRADHTDVARLLQMVGVSNPMLPLRQQIDPVDRARAQLETVDYWSAEKPYYSNVHPAKPAKSKMGMGVGSKKASHPNLLQESKSRFSLFWRKQPPSKPLEALPNYTEGLHNPDPFATEPSLAEQPSSWRGERPLRHQAQAQAQAQTQTQVSALSTAAPNDAEVPTHAHTHPHHHPHPYQHSHAHAYTNSPPPAPPPGDVLPAPRPGKPGKISVRQLTTAALQPMAEP